MEQRVVMDWAGRNPAAYGCMLDFYRRGARVCRASADSLILINDKINICYAAGPDASAPELRGRLLVLTDSKSVADTLTAEGAYKEVMPCTQAVYLKQEPPELERPGLAIRPLTMDDLNFVLENYHNPGAYEAHIRERIQEGMLGGLVDGELAGFAGIHQEGTMGMLEVLPRFRRRGLGEFLECALIRRQLERGRLPYCHVREGNTVSQALQEKLGLVFDSRTVYWLG